MSYRADPNLLVELKKYGDMNIQSCFNCGNCTAVCPLSTEDETFPRRIIRFAQLGLSDRLLSSRELWMCYYCGECTQTCPREADPGEFMAAVRRYAIAKYDRFGIARLLYTSPVFNILFLIVMTIALSLILYAYHGPMSGDTLRLFDFIPSEVVHNLGLIAGLFIAVTALMGLVNMAVHIGRAAEFPKGVRFNWLGALWDSLGVEAFGQKRYRQDCEAHAVKKPWYYQDWFIHASVLWGFIGLFIATSLDYLFELLAIKPTGTWMPLWNPIRSIGTVAGIFLVYGTTVAILKRFRKQGEASVHSMTSDWIFLVLMWLAGMTGFALEISIYLPQPYAWSYWMLLVHLVVVGDLLILAPFTKFAHAMYRPLALYFYSLKPVPESELSTASTD
jgi:ferredoxin